MFYPTEVATSTTAEQYLEVSMRSPRKLSIQWKPRDSFTVKTDLLNPTTLNYDHKILRHMRPGKSQ